MTNKGDLTPIKCKKTGTPLHIGDFVRSERDLCGYLQWDEYYNRFTIRTASGGNVYAMFFTLIKEFKP